MKKTLLAVLIFALSPIGFGGVSFAGNLSESRSLNERLRLARRSKAIGQELARLENEGLKGTQKFRYARDHQMRTQVIAMAMDAWESENPSSNQADEQTTETANSVKKVFNAKEGWDLIHQIPD